MLPNLPKTAHLATFTVEILNGKLFFCSVISTLVNFTLAHFTFNVGSFNCLYEISS